MMMIMMMILINFSSVLPRNIFETKNTISEHDLCPKIKNFTKEQKHLIKQCMIDAEIMGLGETKKTIVYVKSRLD